jgi:sortase A
MAALDLAGCGAGGSLGAATAPVVAPKVAAAPAAQLRVGRPALDQPVMADRLEIPAIDVDVPVVELGWHAATNREGQIFSEWDVAEYAAGWHKNSARLGEPGNIVMSGHNNILGAVFRELDQLKKGNAIILYAGEQQAHYAVDQVVILPEKSASPEQRKENTRWIGPSDDDRLTLVSCWPRNNNTHRIVVVARPVPATQAVAP